MVDQEREDTVRKIAPRGQISRRDFVRGAGIGAAGLMVGSAVGAAVGAVSAQGMEGSSGSADDASLEVVPVSQGYLIVDTKKCAGCASCMLACSLAHDGVSNLSRSRIQIVSDPYGSFPSDVQIAMCRQCEDPICYDACPQKDEVFMVDPDTGVRYINEDKCSGCKDCVDVCYFTPTRIVWDSANEVALKCDLCRNTPHWDSEGKQACVEVCPVGAIKFVEEKPDSNGYEVNLRGDGWGQFDLPTD